MSVFVVILLTRCIRGPPGVGKTSTAELLAEYLQRALILVSAELGITAQVVEERLPRVFKRATRWKAVLLLDEADILLKQRSVHDVHRNALVSVFLRTLEHYQGMIGWVTSSESLLLYIFAFLKFKLSFDAESLNYSPTITAATGNGSCLIRELVA